MQICLAEVQAEKLAYKQKLRWFGEKYNMALELSDDEVVSDDDGGDSSTAHASAISQTNF